ncbi:MAG: ribosome maturation factor RimM [Woeseiaceae bacterium]
MIGELKQPVQLGRVSGLFGVKGWVKVYSYTQPREAILDYDHVHLMQDGDWRDINVAEGKKHGKGVILRFDGVDDRDQAATLVDCEIAIERAELPATGDDSFYWADLEGLQIKHRDGTDLGRVAYLLETGANDVLVTTGSPERLIPFVLGDVILDVDLAAGVITVEWELD